MLAAVCLTALLAAGCSKRQIAARIVFLPSVSAPEPAVNLESNGSLAILEPQPPDPEPEASQTEPEPVEPPRAKPRVRPAVPDVPSETEPAPDPASPVEVPVLEPLGGPAEHAAQRQQVAQLQEQVRARITKKERARLSANERRMITDARTFLSQSERAVATSDFQRALTLARKASMLLAVLEQE